MALDEHRLALARRACRGLPGSGLWAAGSPGGLDLPARRACRAWLAGRAPRAGLGPSGACRGPAGPADLRGPRPAGTGIKPQGQSLPSRRLPTATGAAGRSLHRSGTRGGHASTSGMQSGCHLDHAGGDPRAHAGPAGSSLALAGPNWTGGLFGRRLAQLALPGQQASRAWRECLAPLAALAAAATGLVCGHRPAAWLKISGLDPLVICISHLSTGEGGTSLCSVPPSGVPVGRSSPDWRSHSRAHYSCLCLFSIVESTCCVSLF